MHLPVKENVPTNSTPKVGWMPLVLLYTLQQTPQHMCPPHTLQAGTSWAESACWFPVAEEPRMKEFLDAPLLASSILVYCIGRRGGEETACSLRCPSLALLGSSTTALRNSQGSIKMHSRHPGGTLKIPGLPIQQSSPTLLALPQPLESPDGREDCCCPP